MLNVKNLLTKILESLTVKAHTYTLPSTVAMSGLMFRKCGNVVTIMVTNPTKLAVGSNTLTTLPVGWRPPMGTSLVLTSPSGGVATGSTIVSLRLNVNTAGLVTIYNYRSSAISGDTNASGVMTYIATQ